MYEAGPLPRGRTAWRFGRIDKEKVAFPADDKIIRISAWVENADLQIMRRYDTCILVTMNTGIRKRQREKMLSALEREMKIAA